MVEAAAAAVPAGIRVLLVEEDVSTRVGIRAILSAEPNIEVVGETESGAGGVELARRLSPDVVLTAIRLPDGDGIIAATHILSDARRAGVQTAVIVLTTFFYGEHARRAMEAGASAFLSKHCSTAELVTAVAAVAGGAVLAPRLQHDDGNGPSVADLWLTGREYDVLALLCGGQTNEAIADRLFLSIETVRSHVKHVYAKIGAHNRAQAVAIAYEKGLVDRAPMIG